MHTPDYMASNMFDLNQQPEPERHNTYSFREFSKLNQEPTYQRSYSDHALMHEISSENCWHQIQTDLYSEQLEGIGIFDILSSIWLVANGMEFLKTTLAIRFSSPSTKLGSRNASKMKTIGLQNKAKQLGLIDIAIQEGICVFCTSNCNIFTPEKGSILFFLGGKKRMMSKNVD
ncbi:hypothetical protein LXL04_007695 [Taraxacum kok-saghyz]